MPTYHNDIKCLFETMSIVFLTQKCNIAKCLYKIETDNPVRLSGTQFLLFTRKIVNT